MSQHRLRAFWIALFPVLVLVTLAGSAVGQPPAGTQPWPNQPDPGKNFNADEFFAKNPNNGAGVVAERQLERIENGKKVVAVAASPIIWISVAFILLSVGAWIYVKLSATTDPLELAETDPWIQARLAQSRANAQDADPLGARAQDEPPG